MSYPFRYCNEPLAKLRADLENLSLDPLASAGKKDLEFARNCLAVAVYNRWEACGEDRNITQDELDAARLYLLRVLDGFYRPFVGAPVAGAYFSAINKADATDQRAQLLDLVLQAEIQAAVVQGQREHAAVEFRRMARYLSGEREALSSRPLISNFADVAA